MTQSAKRMLEGYRVLDFTQVLAGPTTTRYMGEMGADVIKVEFAPKGDISRGVPYLRDGRSAYYVQQNRGKKSLCLDLRNPAAAAIIKELIPKVDVLVENYAPGVIGRLGFGYEAVKALNPKLVMCSISTFGQHGPLANRPGYDFIGCAYSGVLSMIGERNGRAFVTPGRPRRYHYWRARALGYHCRAAPSRTHWRGPVHRDLVARLLLQLQRYDRAHGES